MTTAALILAAAWLLSTTLLVIFLFRSGRPSPTPPRRDEGSARDGGASVPVPAAPPHPAYPAPTVTAVGGLWIVEYPNGRPPFVLVSTPLFERIVEARNDAVKARAS